MAFTAAYLNLMRKMYMIRMELMMRLMRPGELKEQDLLSRFGNSEGDANIDYYPTPIPPQIGDNHNHGLVSTRGVGAFRPWGISNYSDHVSPNNNNNSTINTGFIDFIGTTPVLASLPPPHPTIPIFSAQLNGHTLSLAPAAQTIDDHMIPMSSSKPFKRAEVADQKPPRLDHPDGYQNGKTCTKCKRNNTPLWRNGPHGPKTLCNACGIRFRKKEKKAALGITDQQEFLKPRNGIRKPN